MSDVPLPLPTRITLVGPSDTGKTTAGLLVAKRLGWEFANQDTLLKELAGRSIHKLLRTEGARTRRSLMVEVMESLRGRERLVVADSADGMRHLESRIAMAEDGLVICLQASLETIQGRRAGERAEKASAGRKRKTWASDQNIIDRVQNQQRLAPLYNLADFVVNTDVLTPEEVADEVVRLYEQYGARTFNRPGRIDAMAREPAGLPPIVEAPGATTIVRTASGSYPAYVEWGAIEKLGDYVQHATGARRAFVFTDEHVLPLWGETAIASLRAAGIETATYVLPPGDGSKSLDDAGRAYDWLASQRAERGNAIVALGGGMVGDFSGFIAATYLRGMPVVQVPTSLLAMVDASIGGKTAVNLGVAKNLVGVFYQPKLVVADVATLQTLPRRELVEGLAEVIKHALIRDAQLLEDLEAKLDKILAVSESRTTKVIARNVQIKGTIVSADERETGGLRELLNYGHTLGHAFEAAGGYESLLHGEAVAIGMVAAAAIGKRIGVTPPALVERQNRLIERAGLPLRPPAGLDPDRVRNALALDKKIVSGTQRWVLLEDVGRPIVRGDVPREVVEAVTNALLTGGDLG